MKSPSMPNTVLVADDESLMATGLASSLKSLGFEIVGPASDGQEAIDLANHEDPDIALLDIRMPEVDGLEVAKVLWEEYGIPSIIVSAFSDKQYVREAQANGVFGYMLKPVSTENLRVTISIAWARALGTEEQAKRIEQLETTLTHRRIVEQAKWKLIETHGWTEAEAHTRLQREARNNRRKLIDVANEVLETGKLESVAE